MMFYETNTLFPAKGAKVPPRAAKAGVSLCGLRVSSAPFAGKGGTKQRRASGFAGFMMFYETNTLFPAKGAKVPPRVAKAGVWLCGFYDVLRNQYVVSREERKGSAKGRKGGRLALRVL